MKGLFFSLLVCLFSLLFTPFASADNDYPYRNESHPDCMDRCILEDMDGYIWDFCKMNCTSFVAWRMNRDGVDFKNRETYGKTNCHWGNAYNWDDNAKLLKLPVNNIPDRGAVAQWDAQGSGALKYGHVAYVESVNGDGSVNISEYNYEVSCGYGTRPNQWPDHYIHVISLITADGSTVYWLQNNKIYHVIDADTLNTMQNAGIPGWNWSYITTVSCLSSYIAGPEFISTNSSSNGLLIRLYGGNDVYLINNGKKEYISYGTFIQRGYDWNDIIDVPQAILDMFPNLLPDISSSTTTIAPVSSTTTHQSSSTTTIQPVSSSTTTIGNSSTTTIGNSSTTTIAPVSSTTTHQSSSTTTIQPVSSSTTTYQSNSTTTYRSTTTYQPSSTTTSNTLTPFLELLLDDD